VLAVLKTLARHPGGVSLEELTRAVDSPKPTVHRALVVLRRAGFADRNSYGHYQLGDEFLRIAFAHHEARPEHVRIRPALERLAQRFGETAHYAVLDGREVVYRAKVDPPVGAIRLTSIVGGRNPAHTTGVGKILLAYHLDSLEAVKSWIGRAQLVRKTAHSLCRPEDLWRELEATRERGYAVDDQENEVGVNCVALPVFATSSTVPAGAVSISGLTYRTPLAKLVDAVDEIRAVLEPADSGQR
jgi:IclR family acetate operon transcriptional repressor